MSFTDQLKLFKPGAAFFDALIDSLDKAENYIHFQIYIFQSDITGLKVGEALVRAARRGVKVFVVIDAYGSYPMQRSLLIYLRSEGIRIRFFAPLFGRNGFGIRRRLHHKIITVDGKLAYTGGMNIGDRYSGLHKGEVWMDQMIRFEGTAVHEMEKICLLYWDRSSRKLIPPLIHADPSPSTDIKVLRNDRFRGKAEVADAYRELIKGAERSIFLVASYFLPGSTIRKALRDAARRGVMITLILPGKSDVGLASYAMRHLYPRLLNEGIELFEWEQTVLHAKWMSVDKKVALFGSFNLNHLSDFSSIEANVEIRDTAFIHEGEDYFLKEVLPQCKRIDPVRFQISTGFMSGLMYRIAFVITRFLFRFMYRITSKK